MSPKEERTELTTEWRMFDEPSRKMHANEILKLKTPAPKYRAEKKSLQILLSSNQAGPGGKVKQEQEEISRNHVPRLFLRSLVDHQKTFSLLILAKPHTSNLHLLNPEMNAA